MPLMFINLHTFGYPPYVQSFNRVFILLYHKMFSYFIGRYWGLSYLGGVHMPLYVWTPLCLNAPCIFGCPIPLDAPCMFGCLILLYAPIHLGVSKHTRGIPPMHTNITKAEHLALENLGTHKDGIIVTADKGVVLVVMDTTEYITKCEALLQDNSVQQHLSKDTSPTIQKELI